MVLQPEGTQRIGSDGLTGPHVVLAVHDNGCGMDQKTLDRAFEPFFTTKGKDKGTGLGLATVCGIVRQHEGDTQVKSEVGRGTTIRVFLPISDQEPASQRGDTIARAGSGGSETIMLVEDDRQVRRLALSILRREGYTVLSAPSGIEALRLMKQHDGPIQLLLTDVVMPEMNGRELFERAVQSYPSLRVLYMSGYADDVIGHHGVLDEAVDLITKPFMIKDLTAKVRAVLDRS